MKFVPVQIDEPSWKESAEVVGGETFEISIHSKISLIILLKKRNERLLRYEAIDLESISLFSNAESTFVLPIQIRDHFILLCPFLKVNFMLQRIQFRLVSRTVTKK